MQIAVLGTGVVGRTIATKLVDIGHEVMLGSRSEFNEEGSAWAAESGLNAQIGTFAEAAAFGDVVFNCTNGQASLEALTLAGGWNFAGKLLIDVANPLDFSTGVLKLTIGNGDSLGERIQAAFPDARVVKTLNTVNAAVMVDPSRVAGEHVMFISGNDHGAKQEASELLEQMGWPRRNIVDLGDITGARGQEAHLNLWLTLAGALDTKDFNVALAVRQA